MDFIKFVMLFFGCFVVVDGWQDMEFLYVIWCVQINFDKNYYVKYEMDVIVIVEVFSGLCGLGDWIVLVCGIVFGVFGDG